MPTSMINPLMFSSMTMMKFPFLMGKTFVDLAIKSIRMGTGALKDIVDTEFENWHYLNSFFVGTDKTVFSVLNWYAEGSTWILNLLEEKAKSCYIPYQREIVEELGFWEFFTEKSKEQDWSMKDTRVLLDLPGMRLLDISQTKKSLIQNYTVIFAPRAGHHSNIAERVAIFLRSKGLNKIAVVEQKCAEDIPLYVEGERHYENFSGQVEQYRQILEYLKQKSGVASHLVAVCQPGPLLASTLILHPELGKTFGSAGSPMNTDGQTGFLSDFARTVGEGYIDFLIAAYGKTVPRGYPGEGRRYYDGRIQVGGFYLLGASTHFNNLLKLISDIRHGDKDEVKRQKEFYDWYNTAYHFPKGFIEDTFKKIFVRNALYKGELFISGSRVRLKDYPEKVPIWAIGGEKDNIAPLGQALGHMGIIKVPKEKKLILSCKAGHMGLFRSKKVLEEYYAKVADFILTHSDF